MNGRTVGSVQEYLETVEFIPTESPEAVYRGEPAIYSTPCCPGLFRDNARTNQSLFIFGYNGEKTNVMDWCLRVTEAEGRHLSVRDDLERLILAQHFGVKTRLLDWSSNPLVALWFASSGKCDQDGVIYTSEQENLDLYGEMFTLEVDLNSDRYNALAVNPFCLERPVHASRNAESLKPFTEVHFFRPTYLPDNRVMAQKAVISIHPNPSGTPDTVRVAHVTIEAAKKMKIRSELDVLGISHRTLGLATRESIARDING